MRVTWLLPLAIAVYLIQQATFGRFLSYDEIEYKAPGREWAESGRFAAPELENFWKAIGTEPVMEPSEFWLLNSPLYPMLFGLFVDLRVWLA